MEKNAKIYVAGHHGLVGSAIVRRLTSEGTVGNNPAIDYFMKKYYNFMQTKRGNCHG